MSVEKVQLREPHPYPGYGRNTGWQLPVADLSMGLLGVHAQPLGPISFITVPKVMFSQASVILFIGADVADTPPPPHPTQVAMPQANKQTSNLCGIYGEIRVTGNTIICTYKILIRNYSYH